MSEFNLDDYMNAAMGLGNARDRSQQTTIQSPNLFDGTFLSFLYIGDGLLRRVVDLPAEEATRCGFEICGDIDPGDASKVSEKLKELDFDGSLMEAVRWKRLFGGSAIVLGVNDGGTLETPLNESKIKDVDFIRVIDRYRMTWSPGDKYIDPADKRFGKVKLWTIQPLNGNQYKVHESRVCIFDGAPLPELLRENNDGWGMSDLQYCYEHAKRFGMGLTHCNNLLERAQQAVHGIPKLSEYIRSDTGKEAVKARAEAVDLARGINNTVVVDEAESYDIHSMSFAGATDILDRFSESLAAVSGIPITKLMGRSPAGMNATGKSDQDNWHARIKQDQDHGQRAHIERIVKIIMIMLKIKPESWEIEFNPLSVPSEKETAETEKINAETAEKYVNMEALDPSEVRADLKENSRYMISDRDVEIDPTKISGDDNAEA